MNDEILDQEEIKETNQAFEKWTKIMYIFFLAFPFVILFINYRIKTSLRIYNTPIVDRYYDVDFFPFSESFSISLYLYPILFIGSILSFYLIKKYRNLIETEFQWFIFLNPLLSFLTMILVQAISLRFVYNLEM